MKRRVDLSTYDNSWYKPGRSVVVRVLWYYVNLIFFNSYWCPISSFKVILLRLFGAKVGKGCVIKPKVNIKYPWKLKVGDNCWIGEKVWIDNLAEVEIGNNVCLSQGAMLLCGNHNYKKLSFDLMVEPIFIDEGAWVGAKSVVCPSVKVGKYAVLSVASMASSDLEENFIYAGNPAKKIRQRFKSVN